MWLRFRRLSLKTDRYIVQTLWPSRFFECHFLPSSGASGGTPVIWDNRLLTCNADKIGTFTVSLNLTMLEVNFSWRLSVVYRPVIEDRKAAFFSELEKLNDWKNEAWCLTSEFNLIRCPIERFSGEFHRGNMQRFSNFISENNLLDLLLRGGRFTWSNNHEIPTFSKLDRLLVSNGF